jgi:hypothetical protein
VFSSTTVARAKLEIAGRENLEWYDSSDHARRGFCARCGSSLFWENPGSGRIDLLLGALTPPVHLEVDYHIFVGGKSDYYRICDGKPQYIEYTNGPRADETGE